MVHDDTGRAATVVSQWVARLAYADIPADVATASKYRILDVLGLSIAGGETPFGRSVYASGQALYPGDAARIWGTAATASVLGAAFTNGALSQALEYDDTHNESIVHMSSPSAAAALALGDAHRLSGRDVIKAVAIGNEISSRIGSITPGQFHKRGFHPSGLFAPFGVCWLAASLLQLDVAQMDRAAGIVGSFAAGLLQCWVDGTQSKFLHPGWAAQSGIASATLAKSGVTGPAAVFEGRFGLFASHLQSSEVQPDYGRLTRGLGEDWESRNASFKPFPVAHVIHPYIDALLRLRAEHGLSAALIKRIVCPVPPYMVGIVCEPVGEKRRPLSDSHGRVSLQYTMAEALVRGRIGKDAYAAASLHDPEILALADRVDYVVDESLPGPQQFKGVVEVELMDGRTLREVEEHNRGSRANPMSHDDLLAKFTENAGGVLGAARAAQVADAVMALDQAQDASDLTRMTTQVHA
jgi:2-methylcitrate dehydratase PrpD